MLHTRQLRSGDTLTVQLVGTLDRRNADQASAALNRAVADAARLPEVSVVVLDLHLVTDLDATGVALLVGARAELRAVAVDLLLTDVQPHVAAVFHTYLTEGLFAFAPGIN